MVSKIKPAQGCQAELSPASFVSFTVTTQTQ
jgi:hypothetical protein